MQRRDWTVATALIAAAFARARADTVTPRAPVAVADGLYATAPHPARAATTVRDVGGAPVHLLVGRPIAAPLELRSRTNRNDQYWLTARMRRLPDAAPWPALAVRGRVFTASSVGSDARGSEVCFLLGRADADAAAAALRIPRHDRRPLDGAVAGRFTAPPRAPRGGPIPVIVTLENRGALPIYFAAGGAYRGSGRDNRFSFTVERDGQRQPDAGTSMHFGGLGGNLLLRPGERRTVETDLRLWCACAAPGRYAVRATYATELAATASPRVDEQWDHVVAGAFDLTID